VTQSPSNGFLKNFFDNCIADTCFNMKWKTIEDYGLSLQHRGTIEDVLQRLQMHDQALFTPELFDRDTDRSEEIRIMCTLAVGKSARDRKTGKVRTIGTHDIADWVQST